MPAAGSSPPISATFSARRRPLGTHGRRRRFDDKTNTLGFVVGVPIGYAIGNVNQGAAGARSVNPKAQVRVVVIGSSSDQAKEAAAAVALEQGNGPRDACRFARDHHSGGGEPRRSLDWLPIGRSARACAQGLDYRPRLHLGSVHDRHRKEHHGWELQARHRPGRPRRNDRDRAIRPMPEATQAQVTAAADKVAKGFNPFTGPIIDNTGVVRIKEGEAWGGDKMGNFDWYVDGVIGKAK